MAETNALKHKLVQILRRVPTKIAAGAFDTLGEVSTVSDPTLLSDPVARARRQL